MDFTNLRNGFGLAELCWQLAEDGWTGQGIADELGWSRVRGEQFRAIREKLHPLAETLYAGEKRKESGYYKHRGITVFWFDELVTTSGWQRDHAVEADFPERPSYVPPMPPAVLPGDVIVEDNNQAIEENDQA